jgi:hypothetical protein
MDSDLDIPKRQSSISKSKRPSAALLNPLLPEEKPSNNSVARPVSKDDKSLDESVQNPLVSKNHELQAKEEEGGNIGEKSNGKSQLSSFPFSFPPPLPPPSSASQREVINSPDSGFNRKHSTATNHSSDSSGGYATATSGNDPLSTKTHSINTEGYGDPPSRRQTFTGITSDENYWLETNRGSFKSGTNPSFPSFRGAGNNHNFTAFGAGNACHLINETINNNSIGSADSKEDNFSMIDYSSLYSKRKDDSMLASSSSSNPSSPVSSPKRNSKKSNKGNKVMISEEKQVINEMDQAMMIENEKSENNGKRKISGEDRKESNSTTLPSSSYTSSNKTGTSSLESGLLIGDKSTIVSSLMSPTTSVSRSISHHHHNKQSTHICCYSDYCFPCDGSSPYNNTGIDQPNQSGCCLSSCLDSSTCCCPSSSSSYTNLIKLQNKKAIEIGDLYEFFPTKEIPYFLLYESPNINHRYFTIIRKQSSLIFVLAINGNYKLIQSNGFEGWIYLPNNIIYPSFALLNSGGSRSSSSVGGSGIGSSGVGSGGNVGHNNSIERTQHESMMSSSSSAWSFLFFPFAFFRSNTNALRLIDSYPLFKEWTGENHFLCNGKIMLGKDKSFFFGTLFFTIGSAATFFLFVINDLSSYFVYKVIDLLFQPLYSSLTSIRSSVFYLSDAFFLFCRF